MNESAALLYERCAGPEIIAREDVRLRGRAFGAPASLAKNAAEDWLRQWAHVLELSLLFSTVEEAVVRLGLKRTADVVSEIERVNSFVINVSRLDVARVIEENRAALEPFMRLQPHADGPASADMGRVRRAVQSLLLHCPIATLEQTGHRFESPELAHRCRLAFDGLTSFVARNSHPDQHAIATAGQAYAEGRLSIDEVAAVLGLGVPDVVALLEEHGYRRGTEQLRLSDDARRTRLDAIRRERLSRGNGLPNRPDWVAREVVASQRIEDIDARPWLRP